MSSHLAYAQLQTTDFSAAKAFYAALCNWTIKDDPPGPMPPYAEVYAERQMIAGIMPVPEPDVPAHWLLYLSVDDLDAAVRRAKELGATVLVPPTDIGPKHVRISILKDPFGAEFAFRAPIKTA